MKRAPPPTRPVAVVVAVTDHASRPCICKTQANPSTALRALTTAALLLPGLQSALGQSPSDNDTTSVQVSRFNQSYDRDTALQAWTLDLRTRHALSDRFTLRLGVTQDSWSGATPVTVAPTAFGGNRPVLRDSSTGTGTVISGASPVVNGKLWLDRSLQTLFTNADGSQQIDNARELIMSSASPEVRQQIDLGFDFAGNGQRHALNLSRSSEPDFRSMHADWHSQFDFNRQQSTLALGAGYTHSDIDATLDHNLLPYLALDNQNPAYVRRGSNMHMQGTRTEQTVDLGMTQILSQSSVLDLSLSLTHSQGLLENPYKVMTVVFAAPFAALAGSDAKVNADVRALPEQRPDTRLQKSLSLRYVQQVTAMEAALHIEYNFSRDDWQIDSHSVEIQWLQPLGSWLLAPHLRWYSQQAASFHHSYLVSQQSFRSIARNEQGLEIWQDSSNANLRYLRTSDGTYLDSNGKALDPALLQLAPQFVNFSRALLPANFSSDARLGGFGVVSTGLSLQKHFVNGLTLEAGVDHYRRASTLQWGGSGDTPYADSSYWSASLGLQADWEIAAHHQHSKSTAESEHSLSHVSAMSHFPAGMDMLHAPMPTGSFMVGYKAEINNPMMTMHMLELDYALSEHWSLMLMPQFMSMQPHAEPVNSSSLHQHVTSGRQGEPTDLIAAASWYAPTAAAGGLWQLSTGLGVPTTASGTLDIRPSLSYSSDHASWQWGSRVNGQHDLEHHEVQDHEPHSSVEFTGWISTDLGPMLSTSLRAVWYHSSNASDALTPLAEGASLGLGVTLQLAGQPLSLEWLQPLQSTADTSGNSRNGSLFVGWHHMF